MSAIWTIGLYSKLTPFEAECCVCKKKIKMADCSTKGLFFHAKQHEEYAAKLKELEEREASQKNSLEKFVKVLPKVILLMAFSFSFNYVSFTNSGELSSLDKRVMHLIACEHLPFSIVDGPTFKPLQGVSDRENLKGRHHYSDWVLPRMYEMVKAKVQELLLFPSFLALAFD